jgi:zinc/manganese transport system substrate-binding protein
MAKSSMNIGIAVAVIVVVLVVAAVLLSQGGSQGAKNGNTTQVVNRSATAGSGRVLQVVAGENFWGSLVGQLCGIHCNVTSIVTDPNANPHDYEASASDARAIANANFVIINGVDYDDWALQLLAASPNPNRTVLNVANLLNIPNGSNPHLWYGPKYVNATVKQMYEDLVAIDPNDSAYYLQQYNNLTAALQKVDARIGEIKQQFGGTKVASTESIFVYLANASGLDLVSPPAFMEAVAEGNDPPEQSVATFENQLENGSVVVLVYNEQTVTPLTSEMKQIAQEHNITVTGVTETIQPPDVSFETWMTSELINLQNALNANALGN